MQPQMLPTLLLCTKILLQIVVRVINLAHFLTKNFILKIKISERKGVGVLA
jgi:hypothetical protein